MSHSVKRTEWYSRSTPPSRTGYYECILHAGPNRRTIQMVEWDGKDFLDDRPVIVWRGLTKKAHDHLKSYMIDLVDGYSEREVTSAEWSSIWHALAYATVGVA